MKIISTTKAELVLQPSRNDETWRSFVFDVGIVPEKPRPKRVVIRKHVNAYLQSWSMTWRKFLRQGCVGGIAIIHKSEFSYQSKYVGRRAQTERAA